MRNVVVADDEAHHRRGLGKMIKRLRPQYQVVECKNGKEAYEYFCHHGADIMISDIRMPIMDGLELMEKIGGEVSETKVVLLTSYAYFEYAQKAVSMGAFDYLVKPVNEKMIVHLLQRIESQIETDQSIRREKELLLEQVNSLKMEIKVQGNTARLKTNTLPNGNQDGSGSTGMKKNEQVVRRALQYIEEHFAEDLSLEWVAANCHFNVSYFSSLIKRETGVNFSQHLTNVRIRHARELLRTNAKVYEVAMKTGYKDAKYFIRVFKKEMGMAPDEFRKRSAEQ